MGRANMRNVEVYPQLEFGCTYLLPVPAVACAWGARGTWQDGELHVYHKQSFGPEADKLKLRAWLVANERKFPAIMRRWRTAIDTAPQILYEDIDGVLFVDGNESTSYVYMAAMLWEVRPFPSIQFRGDNLPALSGERVNEQG